MLAMSGRLLSLTIALFVCAPATALAANPGAATTKTNQQLTIRIDSPANGATVPLADLPVSGTVSLSPLGGGSASTPPAVMYILDTSGSTDSPKQDCNGDGAVNASDDFNADGTQGDVLDCEIAGAVALNASIKGSVPAAGLISFATTAAQADVDPAGGDQPFVSPAVDNNGNGQPDVEEVARSVTRGTIKQFTPKGGTGGGTEFDPPLAAMNAAFGSRGPGRYVAFFLTDGQGSVNPNGPLAQAKAAGYVVNTFSVGGGGAGCAPSSQLKTISDTTGGTCTEVKDPSQVAGQLAGAGGSLNGTSITGVALSANNLPPLLANLAGQSFSGVIPASQLRNGSNPVVAGVATQDGTQALADVTVNVGSGLLPANASGSRTLPLPSNRRCISRRAFPIKVRRYAGVKWQFATVAVNNKPVKVYVYSTRRARVSRIGSIYLNSTRRFRAFVDLRGLVKGTYRVRVSAVTTRNQIRTNFRTYRTCARKLAGSIPRL
jgi:hypothetical protein